MVNLIKIKECHHHSLKGSKKSKEGTGFKKFFDIFSKLHVNLSLLDVLQGMPSYAKYLKKVMANKKYLVGL